MPLQNRVLPTGEIVAIAARGTMTGNRGILHRENKTLGTARWTHHAWICCTLDWQGRKRPVMTGRNWTELFFLDEAVAFAAGHRPCGYCRRSAYKRYVAAWEHVTGTRPKAPQLDKALHAARIIKGGRQQQTGTANCDSLPDGTIIIYGGRHHLLVGPRMLLYSPDGYGLATPRPSGTHVTVLTPSPTVAVLRAGYAPALHPTATLSLD
ncbi:hypothetical protein [Yoonia sediminilitoris]|uniref:Uncharacterized protein n=1 Tax=Yoonia sediminilitoris TaxID=1286148 RepID=A0A2T6KDV7_9RHOB|nr:hypothetical protein [Yoonia sediminilitoris]PUB13225.1 hypothetical protein C8N45_108146 [Yoonia sediminilitoris]RCW94560.1 hypothetical protein DFP92_108147 [Yoonia sediminilitoris]